MARRKLQGRPGAAARTLFLLLLLPLLAAVPSEAANTVSVEVGAVYASNEGKSMDTALGTIRGKLQSMFNYTSYRMLDRKRRSLAVGEAGEFELPGRRTMRATPLSAEGNKIRLPSRSPTGRKTSSPPPSGSAGAAWSWSEGPPTRPAC